MTAPAAAAAVEPFHGTLVLLATCNGATFLQDQLSSIAAQDDHDWRLLVRDDRSTDATPELLEAFAAARAPGQVARLPGGEARIGALGAFLDLLAQAPPARRYAFCDQDDVWLPAKLAHAARAIEAHPADLPVLYCARQRIVDATLHEIGLSPEVRRPPSLRNALVQNIATGCTVAMNDAARRAVLAVPAPATTLHDWWSYLVVAAVGGRVIFDPTPVMLYRQHASNAVGARPGLGARAMRAAARGPAIFMRRLHAHAQALLRHPSLTLEARALLRELDGLPQAGPFGALRRVRRAGLRRQTALEQAGLWALVAAGAWIGRGAEPTPA